MSQVTTRIVSAVLLTAIGLSLIIPFPLVRALFIIFTLTIGAYEYFRIWNHKETQPLSTAVPFIFSLYILLILWGRTPYAWLGNQFYVWIGLLGVLAFVWHAFYHLPIKNIFPWLQFHFFGVSLFTFWASSVLFLVNWTSGVSSIYPLLATLICMTFADSGAFFVGRKWGSHKLAPQLSPKKTIEGLLGGIVCSTGIAVLMWPLLPELNLFQRAGFGVLMAITATLGDLLFSCIKRWSGTKDFGNLIPGHGGILDRFDSLFFSAPFAVYYITSL